MKRPIRKIHLSLVLALFLLAIALLCTAVAKDDPFDDRHSLALDTSNRYTNADFNLYMRQLFCQEASSDLLTLHYALERPKDYGIESYQTRLGVYSAQNVKVAAAAAENIRQALSAFDPSSLSLENQLTLETLSFSLDRTAEAAAWSLYEEPLRPSTGIQSELPILLAEYSFHDAGDVRDYLQLLESIPDYFTGIETYEREKSAAGLFMSDFAAKKIIDQCNDFSDSGEKNYLIYTFEQKTNALKDLNADEKAACQKQNRTLILQNVLPAFRSLADTLAELQDTGTNGAGLCAYPNGREWYAHLVCSATGSTDSIERLQERTNAQRLTDLAEAARLVETYPSLAGEAAAAKAPAKSPEEMLKHLQQAILADFPAPLDCESTVKYVDAAMEDYLAPAFYLTSPIDNPKQNSIYINRGRGYEGIRLFTTLAHEGYPGHMYQNTFFHSTSPPPIRALLGCAGYTEGWATYVEFLSYRYTDLSAQAGAYLALEQSAILSLYASADMGIHYDGWSYTDTYRFFSTYGITDESAVRDIFELIVEEPAHYLKYYIGYLEFLSLRGDMQAEYGEDFSVRAFHQAILEIGPAPFPIVKKYLPVYYRQAVQSNN